MTATLLRNAITHVNDLTVVIDLMGRVVMIEIMVMASVGLRHGGIMIQMRMGTSKRRQHQGGAQDKAQKAREEAHFEAV